MSADRTTHTTARPRYALIDAVRGITIISMVLYHFCYDVFVVRGIDPGFPLGTVPHIWQQSICWSFILISGFVWSLGEKRNLRRGILINLCGLLVTAVTVITMPSEAIWFGVLNLIGCAILLMIPLRRITEKIPPLAGILCSFLLFCFFRHVQDGFVGFGPALRLPVPATLYDLKFLTPLGFPFPEFRSSDYFPILPWFFLYLCGWFGYRIFLRRPAWQRTAQTHIPVLSAIGRLSLWIYLIHQPVCYLIASLLF